MTSSSEGDRVSNWSTALAARDRDLIERVRAYLIEVSEQQGRWPTVAEIQRAIQQGR